jgi:hypothetical protein
MYNSISWRCKTHNNQLSIVGDRVGRLRAVRQPDRHDGQRLRDGRHSLHDSCAGANQAPRNGNSLRSDESSEERCRDGQHLLSAGVGSNQAAQHVQKHTAGIGNIVCTPRKQPQMHSSGVRRGNRARRGVRGGVHRAGDADAHGGATAEGLRCRRHDVDHAAGLRLCGAAADDARLRQLCGGVRLGGADVRRRRAESARGAR